VYGVVVIGSGHWDSVVVADETWEILAATVAIDLDYCSRLREFYI